MRTLLSLLLAALTLHAVSLERLVERSLSDHPNLQSLKERVAAADAAVARARNLDDPVLTFFVNDLRLDDPSDRSLEPMQTQGVRVTQKFPWLGRRDAKEALAKTWR
ncbi:TolC family protein [Hydrogenimonas sp.]